MHPNGLAADVVHGTSPGSIFLNFIVNLMRSLDNSLRAELWPRRTKDFSNSLQRELSRVA
jgi:hypothetical protein